jgi:hypothetical protein
VPAVDAAVARAAAAKKGFAYTGLDSLALVLTEPDRLFEKVLRYGGLFGEFEEE